MSRTGGQRAPLRLAAIGIAGIGLIGAIPALAQQPGQHGKQQQQQGQQNTGQNGRDLNWQYYGGNPGGMRFRNIDQINPRTVGQLRPVWVLRTGVKGKHMSFETQPIVVNGVMYVTSPQDHVFALDAASGKILWTYTPQMPPLSKLAICCGQANRGVAYGDGKVFIAQLDASLVALDAKTGKQVWNAQLADWHHDATETMAPLFVDNKVIVGVSGGEFKIRGFVAAYDASSGKQLWRFDTVPGPGQAGHES